MAGLDVNEILRDPMLVDTFEVIRRAQGIGDNGRALAANEFRFPEVVGSVQYESDSATQKRNEGQFSPKNIKIWTEFHLYKASDNYLPDQLVWNGELFEVLDVQSYANYGRGFYIGVAKSVKVMNQP